MELLPSIIVISFKRLRDEGLYTFKGMVEYCVKDNGEEHFEFVHHNVSANDTNKGKWSMESLGR